MGRSSDVPAVRSAVALLTLLASRPGPVGAATLVRELGLPRSTTYHLLAELSAAGFVTHLPEERAYGLGVAAFEIGSAYLRHDPLELLARPLLRRMVEDVGETAQLGILHGAETLYLLKEQPRLGGMPAATGGSSGPVTLISDVGVRLPASITASGRSLLAHLPPAQVRALFPGRGSFIRRTDRGPASLSELRQVLRREREQGWAAEEGEVTEGFASLAACAFDHGGRPVAAVTVTFPTERPRLRTRDELATAVRAAAALLTRRLSGRVPDSGRLRSDAHL